MCPNMDRNLLTELYIFDIFYGFFFIQTMIDAIRRKVPKIAGLTAKKI